MRTHARQIIVSGNKWLKHIAMTTLLAACEGFILCGLTGCEEKDEGVSIQKEGEQWTIHVNNRPIFVKGVGGTNRLEVASANGANAFRTWGGDTASIREDTELARKNHLYIMQGIDLPKDSALYYDETFRQKKIDEVRLLAETFKNDTSILAWGIGNEIQLDNAANTPTAWEFVNVLAKEIKSIDKRHLTSTVISHHPEALDMIKRYAPDLDFIGVNSYGDIFHVKDMFAQSTYKGPYLITEWGPTGWWETKLTQWKAPIEQTSEEKRIVYEERYKQAIASDPRCMGSFVFLWGQKEERTPTWFCMFVEKEVDGLPLKGEKTPMVEAMERAWTGMEPKQTAPIIKGISINSISFEPIINSGKTFTGQVDVHDRENDQLTYVWEVLKEATITATGGAYEPRPERVGEVLTTQSNEVNLSITATGYYRLFVYVLDNTGFVATANIPFAIQ